MNQQFLRTPDAAAYLLSTYGYGAARTLSKLRCVGGGPAYQRAGRIVLYTRPALDVWARARLGPPQRSTSERPSRPTASEAPRRRPEGDASEDDAN